MKIDTLARPEIDRVGLPVIRPPRDALNEDPFRRNPDSLRSSQQAVFTDPRIKGCGLGD